MNRERAALNPTRGNQRRGKFSEKSKASIGDVLPFVVVVYPKTLLKHSVYVFKKVFMRLDFRCESKQKFYEVGDEVETDYSHLFEFTFSFMFFHE